jgi:predicted tellurium resistance membrane protein TerC
MKGVAYKFSVIATAFGMFLPLIYGAVPAIQKLLGKDPLLKSLGISVVFWILAYYLFEEEETRLNDLTAS